MKFRSHAGSAKVRQFRGFTLIEMLIVISMILILLSIALPMYNQSIMRARETTLKQNLATINKLIDQYTLDKQKAPQSLEDLVSAGYLKEIPNDITGARDTWQCDQEDSLKCDRPDAAWHCRLPQRLRPGEQRRALRIRAGSSCQYPVSIQYPVAVAGSQSLLLGTRYWQLGTEFRGEREFS